MSKKLRATEEKASQPDPTDAEGRPVAIDQGQDAATPEAAKEYADAVNEGEVMPESGQEGPVSSAPVRIVEKEVDPGLAPNMQPLQPGELEVDMNRKTETWLESEGIELHPGHDTRRGQNVSFRSRRQQKNVARLYRLKEGSVALSLWGREPMNESQTKFLWHTSGATLEKDGWEIFENERSAVAALAAYHTDGKAEK